MSSFTMAPVSAGNQQGVGGVIQLIQRGLDQDLLDLAVHHSVVAVVVVLGDEGVLDSESSARNTMFRLPAEM